MSKSKTHSISLIDCQKVCKKEKKSLPPNPSTDDVVNILANILKQKPDPEYQELELEPGAEQNGFKAKLMYKLEERQNELSDFFNDVAKNAEKIFKDWERRISSILMLWDDVNIFAVTTGNGIYKIAKWKNNNFGITFGSLFADGISVKGMGKRVLLGNILTDNVVFSSPVKVSDIQAMDAITKELQIYIEAGDITGKLFKNTEKIKQKVRVNLKGGIKFGISLNYKELTCLLRNISNYENESNKTHDILKYNINLIQQIEKDSQEYYNCYDSFISKFWERIQERPLDSVNTYIPLSNIQYLNAEKYEILHRNNVCFVGTDIIQDEDVASAFQNYINQEGANYCKETFSNFFGDAQIKAYIDDDGNSDSTYVDSIINLLSGEIIADYKCYFLAEGDIYIFKEDLLDRVEEELKSTIDRSRSNKNMFKTTWDINCENEDEFNKKVVINAQQNAQNGCYLFHKNIIDNIEFADLLIFEGVNIKIVHVKDGFNAAMRVLSKQIELSVEKYLSLKRNKNGQMRFFRKLYERFIEMNSDDKSTKNFKRQFPTYKSFETLLISAKTVTFVAAIRGLDGYENSKSATAKYCLNEMRKFCLQKGVGFEAVAI